jgi:hypothetical protein
VENPPGARQFLRAALARLLNEIVVEARRGQRWHLRGDREGMSSKETKTELSFSNIALELLWEKKNSIYG